MKVLKHLSALALALCLLLSLTAAAFAQEGETAYDEEYFASHSWEEIVQDLFARYEADENRIALGYYNTVTGEEQFHQPDKYMIGASIYKVPLNMVFAQRVAEGEMDWDTPTPYYPYADMMHESIVYSNNDISGALMLELGGYVPFLKTIAPYLGVDPENVDPQYYNERFTARQYITCLKTLYENQEDFPRIIETMQQAEPNNYFKLHEQRFDIAHKYGFWQENWALSLNDVGIAFTDDPILLVCFTYATNYAYELMSEYCTLMCDYAQYQRSRRLEAEADALALAAEQERLASAVALAGLPAATQTAPAGAEKAPFPLLPVLGLVFLSLLGFGGLILFRQRWQLRLGWACAALGLVCLSGALFLTAGSLGTLFARPEGDPQESVRGFFEALQAEDYESAYGYLSGYSSLGLEQEPEDEATRLAWEALRQSYDYRLVGACEVNALQASQALSFTSLDLPAVLEAVRARVPAELEALVQQRPRSEVYDENNKFRPEVSQEAYTLALRHVLEEPADYLQDRDLTLSLLYREGRWLLQPGDGLLKALLGGM